MNDPFKDARLASVLAQAIVDTVREPLLVLNAEFCVVAASRSFYMVFQTTPPDILYQAFYDILGKNLDVPELRHVLETIVPAHKVMNDFELEADFLVIGHRTFILNARELFYETDKQTAILLAFEDVTARRHGEREREILLAHTEELLRQKDILLEEMQHRVANSLQIIASILLLKARSVTSEETRQHLHDAHRRVVSVATVQQHIRSIGNGDQIEVGSYLKKLCESLAASMISDHADTTISVLADAGTVGSDQAVTFGLIVTELVINALKYAFPPGRAETRIMITYETQGSSWQLVVSDNGAGKPVDDAVAAKGGLGTSLVKALAQQFDATVESVSSPAGMKVFITRSTFDSKLHRSA